MMLPINSILSVKLLQNCFVPPFLSEVADVKYKVNFPLYRAWYPLYRGKFALYRGYYPLYFWMRNIFGKIGGLT